MDVKNLMVKEAADALEQRDASDHSLIDSPGILEPNNPRSLVNIAPKGVPELLDRLPIEYLEKTEKELLRFVPQDPTLNQLRIAFWKEYDAAQSQMRTMLWANISQMMQRPSMSLAKYFHIPQAFAYILCPPVSYNVFLEEAHAHSLNKIREILDLPVINEEGKVDAKVAEIKLKAAAFIDLRVQGGFLQKSVKAEVKYPQVGLQDVEKMAKQLSSDELDAKIKELEQKKMQQGVVDVDVEPS